MASLPRSERILKRDDFLRIQSDGKKSHSKSFVFCFQATEQFPCRLGIVVSTRVERRATRRNRIKRLSREAFRALKPTFTAPFDLVVIAKHSAISCVQDGVNTEMAKALRHHRAISEK